MKLSRFIGKQLSRLKAGQSYYMIIISTITALGVLKVAFPDIEGWIIFALFPVALFGAFVLGYIMDKSNVVAMDHIKSVEMSYRYLSLADFKLFGFYKVMMKTMFKSIKAVQAGEPFDFDTEFDKEFKKYIKEWSPK